MNKKIKNIASVVQTKSAAVLCTLCAVLFLASCAEEEMADGTHSQKQDLRTVSVNFDMPADKPSFGDGTASRAALDAQPAEILLGDSTLTVSRAEGSTANYSTSSWENDDQLLVKIEAGSTEARLTLKYTAPAQGATSGTWTLIKNNSYVKYTGTAFAPYNEVEPVFFTEDEDPNNNMSITGALTMRMDWTAGQPTVSIIYAPDMEWSFADATKAVSLVQKNSATAATTAPELWTTNDNGWTTPQARLRVNTGRGNVGDVVTLTSKAFVSALETKPQDNVYTATTDDQGDAYFYGTTNDVLKGNSEDKKFEIKLIQMRVPVPPSAPPASEGRSVALDDAKQNVIITLDTPITLLEASDVVPVTLAAETAYKLMAADKRDAAKETAKADLSVIDGSCGITKRQEVNGSDDSYLIGTAENMALVQKQIEAAVAMGITKFTVVNELALYIDGKSYDASFTVVGEAIRQFGLNNRGTKISLTLKDETSVLSMAFRNCTALQSVSAPLATEFNEGAFEECTALERVSAPQLTAIYSYVFFGCRSLKSVTMDEVTFIGVQAFSGCTDLVIEKLGKVTYILNHAFSGLKLKNLEIGNNAASDAYITLNQNAFIGCELTGSVKFHRVVGKENQVDGVTEGNAFKGVITSDLDLYLAAEQPVDQITVEGGMLKWAGALWKSIKVGDKVYTQETGFVKLKKAGVTYAVLDGMYGNYTGEDGTEEQFEAYRDNVKDQIKAATARINSFYVINELGTYKYLKKTIVDMGGVSMERISQVTSSVVGEAFTAFAEVNDGARVSITLADATSVPEIAFSGCTALENIELDMVESIGSSAFGGCTALKSITTAATTIEVSAFSGCTSLESATLSAVAEIHGFVFSNCISLKNLTFGAVITKVFNNMFDNVTNCDLTLAEGQQEFDGDNMYDGKWAGKKWQTITVGTERRYPYDGPR